MKNNTSLILIVVLVVVIIGGAAAYFVTKKTTTVVNTPQAANAANVSAIGSLISAIGGLFKSSGTSKPATTATTGVTSDQVYTDNYYAGWYEYMPWYEGETL